MKSLARATCVVISGLPFLAMATPEQDADFAARCASPDIVRCVGFDSPDEAPMRPTEFDWDPAPYALYEGSNVPPALDTTDAASGNSSLKFTIPSNSGSDAGAFFTNFSDDFSVQFGEGSPHGKEFYVQWRQKFSQSFIDTIFYENYATQDKAGGWKQIIIGEGDRPEEQVYSCTDLEIVVQNTEQRGFPQMYHSCGRKDSRYEPLAEPYGPYDFLLQNAIRNEPDICSYQFPNSPPCFGYVANQWLTFQVHIIVGTPYKNDGVYKHDSTIQLWVALEGEPSRLVIDFSPKDPECQATQTSQPACQTGYDLFNDDPLVKRYGQVWLLPYHTNKDAAQPHPDAYTWYDELIISKSRIPDPGIPRDNIAPAAPTGLETQ